jgi:hypothetical protein
MSADIHAALKRMVRAYDNNEGLPIAEWIATARAALAADPVGEGPLKERPDFIAGYREGLADRKRITEYEEAERRPAALTEPVGDGPTDALVDDLFNRFADSCDEYGLWSLGKDGLRAALRAALAAEVVGEGPILQWTENMPPSEGCRYDHCIAETPFGQFRISWKGWKQFDSPTVDETPWGDWHNAFNSVDEAKAACQKEMDERLARWAHLAASPAPLTDLAARLISESKPVDPEIAEALTPEARWDLYEGPAAPPAPEPGEVQE